MTIERDKMTKAMRDIAHIYVEMDPGERHRIELEGEEILALIDFHDKAAADAEDQEAKRRQRRSTFLRRIYVSKP